MLTNGEGTTTEEMANNDLPLIEHEIVTRIWTSRGSGKAKLDDFAMSNIGSICHCRIEWSKESAADINIIGDTEQDIMRAISKLSVMDECAVRSFDSYTRVTDANCIDRANELSTYRQLRELRRRAPFLLQIENDGSRRIERAQGPSWFYYAPFTCLTALQINRGHLSDFNGQGQCHYQTKLLSG